MIKTDTDHKAVSGASSEVVVCDAGGNSLGQTEQRHELKSNEGTYLSAKKKPGRPKGSKNFPDNGYGKLSPAEREIMEKELGYRCVIFLSHHHDICINKICLHFTSNKMMSVHAWLDCKMHPMSSPFAS
jgi:hypothetical protein